MGAKSGIALKSLQWFIRGIQFCCTALILALFSYFLAALHNHNLPIPTWVRAVEGISGVGVLYTLAGLLLLCCLAGHPVTSSIAILLDVAFLGAFIYVAVANRGGASNCSGSPNTVFGQGASGNYPNSQQDGFTKLPTFGTACRMQTACLAVAIVAIVFFILSILVEVVLVRHRRKEARFGPSPANNYTSGYGRRGKFMGMFKRKNTAATQEDPNALPTHTTPNQVRQSYNTESTAIGHEPAAAGYPKHGEAGYPKHGEAGYGAQHPEAGYGAQHPETGYGAQHEGHTAYPEPGVTGGNNAHLSPHHNPHLAHNTPQHNSNFSTGYAR
ncbi:hypothetical protein PG995_013692 [Apiospora arundinis]|jgi:hypothetical protein|uniref:Membrane-associating domain protein n=1 Tax=Apiospora arundinis TaxID=335852 RepID=A0ABR2I1F9_9PEZI